MAGSGLAKDAVVDRSFDHYARLVRRLLRVPTSTVTLIEPDRQVFPGADGLDEPQRSTRQTPISHSFCRHVVEDHAPLVIRDARIDSRLCDNPAIADFGVVAYVGWPLVDEQGRAVGSLCAMDKAVREWSSADLEVLADLAQACSVELQAMWRQADAGEDLLRAMFDSVEVALAFFDTTGSLYVANRRAEELAEAAGFDFAGAPYAGAHVRRADNLTPVPLEEQIVPRALRGELDDHEMEWIGPPGRQRAVVASAQVIHDRTGTPRGTLVAAYDVTDLARSLSVKDEFITTVSHELRTPLTSILGYLEVLADEVGPGEPGLVGLIDRIRRNADRLLERVQQLLDTADRCRELKVVPVDLAEVAHQVRTSFADDAAAAGVELAVSARRCVVDADRAQVELAVEHLVSNAIKFSPAGGPVTIAVAPDLDGARVTVADSGLGMSADEVAQACDRFWRSSAALAAAIPGFGLGLTLVRDIVAAHGGSLAVESSTGVGTTVTMSLPWSE